MPTPGPWKVEKYKEPYNNTLYTYQVINTDGLIVAKCGTGDIEVNDNARLIAAVPDLLEALEKLAKLGNEPYYGNSIGNEIALDALRKAGVINNANT